MEDGFILKLVFGMIQGYEGILENFRGVVYGVEVFYRWLFLSQDLLFLMIGEQQDLKEQLSELIEVLGEEIYYEVYVLSESFFFIMEGEKIEKSLFENFFRLEEV